MRISKAQERIFMQLSNGLTDYSIIHFVRTARSLINKGLVRHRPKRCPHYVLTKKGSLVAAEIAMLRELEEKEEAV